MRYVVVGGGVSGVCCAQELRRVCRSPDDVVTIVTATNTVKKVKTVTQYTRNIEEIEVEDLSTEELKQQGIEFVQGTTARLDTAAKVLVLTNGQRVQYDKLCLATGAAPKKVADSPYVHVLRDVDSVQELVQSLAKAWRVLVIGNGGIALEVVSALRGVQVVWSLRHGHIGDAFFDLDAAAFLLMEMKQGSRGGAQGGGGGGLQRNSAGGRLSARNSSTSMSSLASESGSSPTLTMHKGLPCARGGMYGGAVGPQWTRHLPQGNGDAGPLIMECGTSLDRLITNPAGDEFPVTAVLSNGNMYGADVIISAIGVHPNTEWLAEEVELADDGGVLVDRNMCSSVADVHAAGDCCTVSWADQCPHWHQMRLWMQARTMGLYAAHCMAGVADDLMSGFNFELFTHVTRFCGKKVVLLGLYNGQKLQHEPDSDIVTYTRASEGPGSHFVRVLLLRGRMQGAVLIGETGLEETFENLILDQLELSHYGPALLDPDVDLDSVFD